MKQIFQVGIPAGIQSMVINLSNALLQSSVNSFGSVAMAGYTAANNILGFLYMSANAVTQACMSSVSYTHLIRYRYELERLLSYINKAVADITDSDISNYMRAYKRIRNIKNSTLKGVRSIYSSFFSWLRDRDRIRKNPMVLVEDIKVPIRVREPFTDAEQEKLLRECRTIRDKAMMEFLYSTAVRVGELVKLNRGDIRFSTKDLIVCGKGDKERVVYLNERTHMYLLEYLESRTDMNPALFVSLRSPHERLTDKGCLLYTSDSAR